MRENQIFISKQSSRKVLLERPHFLLNLNFQRWRRGWGGARGEKTSPTLIFSGNVWSRTTTFSWSTAGRFDNSYISYICYRNTADITPAKLVLKKDLKVVGNSEIILFILQLHPLPPPLVLTKHILFVGKNLWFASEGTNWVSRFLGNWKWTNYTASSSIEFSISNKQ